jgi:hypothetical protein
LVNGLDSLEHLGIDPADFDPAAARTLGDYLDRISSDFVAQAQELLRSTQKPLRLTVVFATETDGSGILESFTGTSRFGGVEPQRLLAATPRSEIGRWWEARRGLLTSVMYRLDTRVLALSLSTSIPMVRRFGPSDVIAALETLNVPRRTDGELVEYIGRSDLGKFVSGRAEPMSETRGRPSADAPAAFDLIATQFGLGGGRDKLLNRAILSTLEIYNERASLGFTSVSCELVLEFAPLIPDVSLVAEDIAYCLEFHWRRGEFLSTAHRSEIAQYILSKLRDYARALGWTAD